MKHIALLSFTACAGLLADTGTLGYIPPRAKSDLEQLVPQLPESYTDLNPRAKLLYVYMTDKEWSYERHEISGTIVRRELSALFGYQHTDGTCGVEVLIVGEENLGDGTYGPPRVRNIHGNDGYARSAYKPQPCPELAKAEQILRDGGCPECVVSAP